MAFGFGRDFASFQRAFNYSGNTPSDGKFRNYWQVTQRIIKADPQRTVGAYSSNLLRGNFPPVNLGNPPYNPAV